MRNRKRWSALGLGVVLAALVLFVPFAQGARSLHRRSRLEPTPRPDQRHRGRRDHGWLRGRSVLPRTYLVRRDEMATFPARGMGRIVASAAAGPTRPHRHRLDDAQHAYDHNRRGEARRASSRSTPR